MPHPPETSPASRYARQLILPEICLAGQQKLAAARVAIVGVGGLGSPAALYLAAAGVGTLGLVDCDVVEISNLQRQIIHGEATLGEDKTLSAARRLADLNSGVTVTLHPQRLTGDNAETILAPYDLVLGCVDDISTRYHINAACVALGKPNVYGAIAGFDGQVAVFPGAGQPCYRCFFQEPPSECRQPRLEEKGVIATLPGVIGCLQANAALNRILGIGNAWLGKMLIFDALSMSFREKALRPDPLCPVCAR